MQQKNQNATLMVKKVDKTPLLLQLSAWKIKGQGQTECGSLLIH